ncbi:uncharacterized protein ACRADG_008500 [Cochliomyia hominivorax]
MARRRKIPVRKHHGVRDPLKQLEAKEKKLKNVINSPPQKDDQKLSYKFQQFKKLADQAKCGKKIKRIHSGIEDKPKDAPPVSGNKKKIFPGDVNKFKNIKQMPGEEDLDYIRRVNRITTESLKEAQYEAKYGVKVIRDPKTGEISIKKKPPNEIDELLKQKKKEMSGGKIKKKKKESEVKPIDPKLAKGLIKQAIKEDEFEKQKEKEKELEEYRRDTVRFGEVVHAPPSILALPRKAQKSETVPRPGKKDNLLLKDLLNPQEAENTKILSSAGNKKSKAISKNQLKVKRKDLPEVTRTMLEIERQKVVSLYRELKKAKGVQADKS